MSESTNPYAAPQAPLQVLPSALKLPPAKRRNSLLQGIVAGLQLGVIGALFITTLGVFTWAKDSTALGILSIFVSVIFISTVVGTMVGGVVQLLGLVFVGTRCEVVEAPAHHEFDDSGFRPPEIF